MPEEPRIPAGVHNQTQRRGANRKAREPLSQMKADGETLLGKGFGCEPTQLYGWKQRCGVSGQSRRP
jgi:hypothetical protein